MIALGVAHASRLLYPLPPPRCVIVLCCIPSIRHVCYCVRMYWNAFTLQCRPASLRSLPFVTAAVPVVWSVFARGSFQCESMLLINTLT